MSKLILKKIIIILLLIISIIFSVPKIAYKTLSFITSLLNISINIDLWSYRFYHYSIFFIFLFFTILVYFLFKTKLFKLTNRVFNYKSFFKYLFLFISSFFVLFFTSTTSPFYPYHTWDDSNCFFTVGQNILNGLVPYRDLVEQKGPLLYFLHTIASLFSKKSFIGVFFIQVFSLFIFSILVFKTVTLFTNKKVIYLIPFITAIFFTSKNFILGDSAEELSFVFLFYPLYCSFKNLVQDKDYSKKELILIGICAGCILWIKYTMCFFFIGWAIIPVYLYIKKSNIKGIFNALLLIAIGIFISSIPFLLYFTINNSIHDLVQVYFYNNIFLYGNSSSFMDIIKSLLINLLKWIIKNPKLLVLLTLSISFIINKNNKLLTLTFLFPFIFTSIGIFFGGNVQPYYSLILDIFLIFSIIPVNEILSKNCPIYEIIFVPLLAIIFSFCFTQYLYISKLEKKDLPHFVISEYINKYQNPTILEYGCLTNGFYTLCNSKPITKYFCLLNIPLQEMYSEQEKIIDDGLVDFVITWDNELKSDKYEFVLKKQVYLRTYNICYLYKNIKTKEPINE